MARSTIKVAPAIKSVNVDLPAADVAAHGLYAKSKSISIPSGYYPFVTIGRYTSTGCAIVSHYFSSPSENTVTVNASVRNASNAAVTGDVATVSAIFIRNLY